MIWSLIFWGDKPFSLMFILLLHWHLCVIPGFLSAWKMEAGGKETIVSATHLALGIEKEANEQTFRNVHPQNCEQI